MRRPHDGFSGRIRLTVTLGLVGALAPRAGLALCGNGIYEPALGEECDDGSANSDSLPDACRSNCVRAWCGDMVIDTGEECDDGLVANDDRMPDACRRSCRLPSCGDGTRDSDEACDHGPPDAECSALCELAGCGTATLDPGEICDDGNRDSDDACLGTCVPNVCGDGWQNLDVDADLLIQEICDPDTGTPPETCRYDCGQAYALCGDIAVEQGEECDVGAANSDAPDAACRTDCQFRRCGDGITDGGADPPEQCDRDPGCGADCRWSS